MTDFLFLCIRVYKTAYKASLCQQPLKYLLIVLYFHVFVVVVLVFSFGTQTPPVLTAVSNTL